MMTEYKCTHGHDLCHTMMPCKECPYCEIVDDDKELTHARRDAHENFSRLLNARVAAGDWQTFRARGQGYVWLAQRLGIKRHKCRIKLLDLATCRRVVEICQTEIVGLKEMKTRNENPEPLDRGIDSCVPDPALGSI